MGNSKCCLKLSHETHYRREYCSAGIYCGYEGSQVTERLRFRSNPPGCAPPIFKLSTISEENLDIYERIAIHKAKDHPKPKIRVEALVCGAQYDSDDTQGSCETCAEVPDAWVLVKPEVCAEKNVSTYSLTSAAGSYECSESGLRWSTAGPVTLQYHYLQWEIFCEEIEHMHYRPDGPLIDIRVLSGELGEIHLPHFLCLGDCDASIHNAVRSLHGQDSGVSLEVCELTRHHAKLVHPSLSPLGLLLQTGIHVKVHCELMLYKTCTSPLTLHAYLVPRERAAIQAVEDQEKGSGVKISKPKPERSLWMKTWFSMRTSCPSSITPMEIKLRYCTFSPNFFEVFFKHAEEAFEMEVISVTTSKCVWKAEIRKNDFRKTGQEHKITSEACDNNQVSGNSRDPSEGRKTDRCSGSTRSISEIEEDDLCQASREDKNISEAAVFVDRHRAELIKMVVNVMPIADVLLSKGLVHPEKYSEIRAAATSEEKMREIYECLRSAGAEGKAAFYGVLRQEEPHLLKDLRWFSSSYNIDTR